MKTTPKASKSAEAKLRKRSADDSAQYKRFREFAREHETDDNKDTFDKIFEKIVTKILPDTS